MESSLKDGGVGLGRYLEDVILVIVVVVVGFPG